jgi:hypothetical protein
MRTALLASWGVGILVQEASTKVEATVTIKPSLTWASRMRG